MARIARWIETGNVVRGPDGLAVELRIKTWHPGFWWAVFKAWRKGRNGRA